MKKIVEVLHQKNSQKRNMNYPVLLSLCLIVFTAYGIPINNRNEKHDNQIEEPNNLPSDDTTDNTAPQETNIQPLAISVFGFHRNVPNDSNNLPSDDTNENTTPHDTNDNMTPQDTSDD
ncbi:uncharacterized protein LOC126907383 isoform X4 [Daktulosphaira vitifoliae]|uniref:uncharacterized protein LOC126907383 isoform X3 n=1 Tax=Daktulosphaira vitifoliae TaxID=58002 RepID=UPI0021A9EEFA|nr:uncharacterized protein LOC126907383 isoform X3 [Daktulosphaira vitifoliae]XP_050544600.1 uncharacterized protein LOC126907383 isoform X4 [Daktulosphaira vitifoliae]